jgi:hypothetical protein
VPDGWQQGRGAWGGLVVGALVRAVERTEPDPQRPVRTVTAHIMAPALVGRHAITVEPLRIGGAMSTWRAVLTDAAGAPVADAVVIAGADRAFASSVPGEWGVAVPPAVPEAGAVARMPGGPPFPVFTRHLDMRPVTGLPLGGGPAESVGWVGYDVPVPMDAAALVALIDAWWPASLSLLHEMPRIATVSFTATLLADPTSVTDEVVLHHSFLTSARDGFTSEHRRLWSSRGELLVDNVQTIVVGS